MKKRIFAGLILAFMMIMSIVPVFAAPAETAPATEATEAAEEATAAAEEAPQAKTVEAEPQKFPEFPKDNAFAVKEVKYAAVGQTVSFTVKNVSNQARAAIFALLEYDKSKLTVTEDYQTVFPSDAASQAQINMTDGVIIIINKAVEPGQELTVKFDAVLASGEKELPEIGLRLVTQDMNLLVDVSSMKEDAVRYEQNLGNIAKLVGSSNAFGAFFSGIGTGIMNNLVVVIAFIILLALIVVAYFVTINKVKKMLSPEDEECDCECDCECEEDCECECDCECEEDCDCECECECECEAVAEEDAETDEER